MNVCARPSWREIDCCVFETAFCSEAVSSLDLGDQYDYRSLYIAFQIVFISDVDRITIISIVTGGEGVNVCSVGPWCCGFGGHHGL